MAQLWSQFTQPAAGGIVSGVFIAGDPVLTRDEIIYFLNYGTYRVVSNASVEQGLLRRYDLQLVGNNGPLSIPRGVALISESDGTTHAALPYSSVIALNFFESDYRTLLLTGNISFNAQRHAPAKSVTVVIRNNQVTHTLSFPPSWIFLGAAGRPTQLAAGKVGVLSITCFGTSDADVIAVWSAQA